MCKSLQGPSIHNSLTLCKVTALCFAFHCLRYTHYFQSSNLSLVIIFFFQIHSTLRRKSARSTLWIINSIESLVNSLHGRVPIRTGRLHASHHSDSKQPSERHSGGQNRLGLAFWSVASWSAQECIWASAGIWTLTDTFCASVPRADTDWHGAQ